MKLSTFIGRKIGSHIHALRSDGEFDSHHFKDLYYENRDQEGADSSLQPPAEQGLLRERTELSVRKPKH